jgi:predicted DNA-binding protein
MEKRKRRPGGGRKPGEFGKLGAVMSLRLPEDLRDQLKQAGRRNGRSMSAELIFRAKDSFRRDRAQKSPNQFAQEVYQRLHAMFEETAREIEDNVEPKWRKK